VEAVSGLTRDVLDRARRSRDARFDGRFFIAVRSTRIYCRPICPSRFSDDSNVRYYATAEEAAEAGYRPCLRCRPEAAPGSPAWTGTSAVVQRALRLIQDGALDQASVGNFANRLGIGVRHLSRLFAQHVGASPATVAQTRRLHFAKRLLDDTNLRITDIAHASGFGSIRRFNDAFLATYRRSPRELRKGRRIGSGAREDDAEITLRLAYRPPVRLGPHSRLSRKGRDPRGRSRDFQRLRARDPDASGHAMLQIRPVAHKCLGGSDPGSDARGITAVALIGSANVRPCRGSSPHRGSLCAATRYFGHSSLVGPDYEFRVPGTHSSVVCVQSLDSKSVSPRRPQCLGGWSSDSASRSSRIGPTSLTSFPPQRCWPRQI
jgi:methylphosphotriester-DNA--protein-cysteine methyltransferase